MATKPWYMPKPEQPTWFFDKRDNTQASNTISEDDWERYDDIQCEIIESAYAANQSEAKIDGYTIDFKNMIQFCTTNPEKRRSVCRCLNEEPVTQKSKIPWVRRRQFSNPEDSRFVAPPLDESSKSLCDFEFSQCPIVEEWIRRNPHYRFKPVDTVEQIAYGIEQEGLQMQPSKTIEAQYVANQLRKHKDKPLHEIMLYCVLLYTYQSFLYKLVNNVLRKQDTDKAQTETRDANKVDTLGPYCCMLRNFLQEHQQTPFKKVYRAINLNSDQVEEYRKSKGQIKTWNAFSSTTLNPCVTERFGNTLFIIQFKNDTAPCYPGRAISSNSMYKEEDEILLYPGVDFRIDEVEETGKEPLKYKIYLSLM